MNAMDSKKSQLIIPHAAYRVCNDINGKQVWPYRSSEGARMYITSCGTNTDMIPEGTVTYFSDDGDAITTKPISDFDAYTTDTTAKPIAHFAKNVYIVALRSYVTFFYDKNKNQISALYRAYRFHGNDPEPEIEQAAQTCGLIVKDQIEKSPEEFLGVITVKGRAHITSFKQ